MTNDLISQAEALLGRFAALKEHAKIKPNAVIFEMIDIKEALIEMAPGLVEEIKQCKSLNNGLMANCNQLRDRCWKAEGELSKWQQIAIDERAQIIQYHRGILHPLDRPSNFWESMPKDEYAECRDLAAKELGLQLDDTGEELTIAYMLGSKDANDRLKVLQEYVRRLEKEFLDLKMNCCFVAHAGGISEEEIIEYKRKTAQAALDEIRRG